MNYVGENGADSAPTSLKSEYNFIELALHSGGCTSVDPASHRSCTTAAPFQGGWGGGRCAFPQVRKSSVAQGPSN